MTTPVNFELAKLLEEKGFDEYTNRCIGTIDKDVVYIPSEFGIREEDTICYGVLCNSRIDDFNSDYITAPTIAEVLMWLYKKHGIWISVELVNNTKDFYFQPTIYNSKDRDFNDEGMADQAKSICKWKEWRYKTVVKAYEEVIEYSLKNLIK